MPISTVSKALAGLVAMIAAIAFSTAAASAFERTDFTEAGFKAAQAAGKPVLVDVFAPWCPTCKAQQQTFDALHQKKEFADVVIMKVDFDSQKDIVRSFKAQSQSTLIAFKGEKETGRSVGITDAAQIEALIATTVK